MLLLYNNGTSNTACGKFDFYVTKCYNRKMLNKMIKLRKISYLRKAGILAVIFSILLVNLEPAVSYGQHYYSYGNTYTGINGYNYYQPSITTANAANVTSSSATLNGLVDGSSFYSTANLNAWFQYG